MEELSLSFGLGKDIGRVLFETSRGGESRTIRVPIQYTYRTDDRGIGYWKTLY